MSTDNIDRNTAPVSLKKMANLILRGVQFQEIAIAEMLRLCAKAWDQERSDATALKRIVAEQAEDDGLWFIARTAPGAYLQRALRRLHAAIEGDLIMEFSPRPEVRRGMMQVPEAIMSDLLQKMQGAIHQAQAREDASFSGTIPWRMVEAWIPLVHELEGEILLLRQVVAIAEAGGDMMREM